MQKRIFSNWFVITLGIIMIACITWVIIVSINLPHESAFNPDGSKNCNSCELMLPAFFMIVSIIIFLGTIVTKTLRSELNK